MAQLSATIYQTEHCLFIIDPSVNWSSPSTAYSDIYAPSGGTFPRLAGYFNEITTRFPASYFSICYIANTGAGNVPNYIDRQYKATGISLGLGSAGLGSTGAPEPQSFASVDMCRYNLPGGNVIEPVLGVFDHEIGHAWGAQIFYTLGPVNLSNGHWLPNSTVDCQLGGGTSTDGYVTVNKIYGDPVNGFHWQRVNNNRSNETSSFAEQTLYLMGLSKTFPTAYVLNNPVYNADLTMSSSSVDTFDHALAVSTYGVRNPDYQTSPKRFKLGFVYVARDLNEVNTVYQAVERSIDNFCHGEALSPTTYRGQTPFLVNAHYRGSVDASLADLDGNGTPVLAINNNYTLSTDGAAVVGFSASDPGDAAPVVSVVPASPQCTVSGNTVVIAGLPDGTHFFTLKAVDTGGKKTFAHFVVEVQRPASTTSVVTQPLGRTATAGNSATFTVTAQSPGTPTYQWYAEAARSSTWRPLANDASYAGVNTATLTVNSTPAMDGDHFLCVVTSGTDIATSEAAALVVNETAPAIVTQPVDRNATPGSSVFFQVVPGDPATTYGYFQYRWQKKAGGSGSWTDVVADSNYANVTSDRLTLYGITLGMNGDQFQCLVTDTSGSTTSGAATLNVGTAPVINLQPLPTSGGVGETVSFTVAVTGTAPFTYQWYRYGTPVGGNAATLTLSNIQNADAGTYGVYITNAFGLAYSNNVSLTIAATPVVTWAPPDDITYGMALDGTQLNATASVPGTFTYTPASGTVLNAGTQTLGVTFMPTDTTNYTTVTAQQSLVVYKAYVPISLSGLNTTYDGTLHAAIAAQRGEVTTFSGTAGSPGSLDGTGNGAQFNQPQGVAVDSAGNLYVADSSNAIIRKITSAGVVTTLAGTALSYGSADGTGSAARFYIPYGVAIDSSGNVYVADTANQTIRKITPAGVVTTLAGTAGASGSTDGTGSAARFNAPHHLAVDGPGNVYVADSYNHTIRKITPAGVVTTFAGTAGISGSTDGTGTAAQFSYPNGVAVDGTGEVYVADFNNHTIRKITPAGVVTTLAGTAGIAGSADGTGAAAQFYLPNDVRVDGAGNLYVADSRSTVRKVTPAGVVTTLAGDANVSAGWADGTGAAARFNGPHGLAVSSGGTVYVADTGNNEIRKITSGGVVTTLAGTLSTHGSADGAGAAARYAGPRNVATDAAGNVYVADSGNNTVRKITPAGVATTFAGTAGLFGSADGMGAAARFSFPTGLAVDTAGNVYVADQSNHTIRKITAAGVVTTFAGTAGTSGSADGTGTAARFNLPSSVAVDTAGNVYVADQYNYTIRKITPAGVVTTLAGTAGLAGSTDGTGAVARFGTPTGVAVDATGNVYVADSANAQIRKITPAGVVTTLAGGADLHGSIDGPGSSARFGGPTGLTVDGAGNVFVADAGNHTIRKITSSGTVTTLAGTTGLAASADGIGTAAQFYSPTGLAVDGSGNLYVADSGNNTIRKITGGGGTVIVTYMVSGNGTTTPPTAVGAYTVFADFNDPSYPNYYGVASGVLVISKATQAAVTINSASGVNFGNPYTATATGGSGTGAIVWALGTGSTAPTPLIHPATGVVASTGAGTVVIKSYRAGDANYLASATTADFTITVGKAAPVISWTAPAAIRQGTALDGTQLNATANTSGTFIYNPPSGTVLPVGTYTLMATFHPADSANYFDAMASQTLTVYPVPIVTTISSSRQVLTPGQAFNLSVTATGTGTLAYQWLHNGRAISGATTASYSIPATVYGDGGWYAVDITDTSATTRSAAIFVTIAPLTTEVRAWGLNSWGNTNVPAGLTDAVAITAGAAHGLALKRDGTLASWGWDYHGQSTPPAGVTETVAVGTGSAHSFAIKKDGTVRGWGWNDYGQVSIPGTLTDVVAIDSGTTQVVALKSDGTVVAWGSSSATPAGLNHVVAISCGSGFNMALKDDGHVVAWGLNTYGQVTGASSLTGIVAVAAGGDFALALKGDGTVVAWGDNSYGQINVPAGLTDVVAIAAGVRHAIALKANGTVVGWGNPFGGADTPPADLHEVIAISAGAEFSVALRDATVSGAPTITTHPASQTKSAGQAATFTVGATGTPTPTYQWQMGVGSTWQDIHDNTEWSGTSSSTLTIAGWAVSALNGIQFRCVVTNVGGSATSNTVLLSVQLPTANFNADGQSDILWRNSATGQIGTWLMNGTVSLGFHDLANETTDWKIIGTGDFNHDGQSDLIWRNSANGQVGAWFMNGTVSLGFHDLANETTDWKIIGTGDFNADGQSDLIWRNSANGQVGAWFMNGTVSTGFHDLAYESAVWHVINN